MSFKVPKSRAWNVSLNRKRIDTVFYNNDVKKEDVRQSLINHDGYDPSIRLNTPRKKKSTFISFNKNELGVD